MKPRHQSVWAVTEKSKGMSVLTHITRCQIREGNHSPPTHPVENKRQSEQGENATFQVEENWKPNGLPQLYLA